MTSSSSSPSVPSSSTSAPPPTPSPSIEQLPANIPHLETDGSNWAIFIVRFREAMKVTRRWGFFDGTNSCPVPKAPLKPTDEETAAAEKWVYDDQVAQYLLSQRLPDSTVVRMGPYSTAALRWERVTNEFTAKSVFAQNDLETTFYDMRCPRGGDVRVFLRGVQFKREELTAAGVYITNKDYQRTVLRGIPEELARFASTILSSAHLVHHVTTVDTETLIEHICEEADRIKSSRPKTHPNSNQSGART